MPTWGCIVLVASLAEGQQALRPLQLLEVLMKLLQHAKPVKCCASCKRKCRTTSCNFAKFMACLEGRPDHVACIKRT